MKMRILPPAIVLIASGCTLSTQSVTPQRPLQFLLVNDVYVGDTLRDGTGGLARVATLRQDLTSNGPVIFFLAGDVLSPSLLSKWYNGKQMVEFFNTTGLDYATFGNHEFDLDRDTLIARIRESRFKWVDTNCILASGDPFPGVARWDTTTVAGTKIGIFGITIVENYRRYVKCVNEDSTAHVAIGQLKAAGAQLIIGLTHQSRSADSSILANEPDLDLILGGHEHKWQEVQIGNRIVVKADANSRTAQIITVTPAGNRWAEIHRRVEINKSIAMDPGIQALAQRWNDTLTRRAGPVHVIAMTPVALDLRDEDQRRGETVFGDIATDAFRAGTAADVAVIASGSMRYDDVIAPGAITNHTLESVFLFANETRILHFQINGARLREVLEHGLSRGAVGWGGWLQVSGVHYTWDPSRPAGSRIVGEITRDNGTVIAPADTLEFAFNDFSVCENGDGYQLPEGKGACANLAQAPRSVDLIAQYISSHNNGVVVPAAQNRINPISR